MYHNLLVEIVSLFFAIGYLILQIIQIVGLRITKKKLEHEFSNMEANE